MRGLAASYGDPYTVFLTPEDNESLRDEIEGEFSGIGAEITNIDGYLTIVSPLPDTPSFRAGIRPKDIIIKIDDQDSMKMSSREAVKLIRGKEGEVVKLTIIRKGEPEPLEIKITRGIIKIPVVKTYEKDDVFVIKIYSFTENSPQEFLKGIQKFIKSKKQKLLIDVRGNPGGHLFAVTYILGIFLEEGKTILTEDYSGKNKMENKELKSGDYHKDSSLVNIFKDNLQLGILMDEGSASASEILAGVLADYKKAILFGKNTFGKGTVQELVDLKNNTSLKVTIAKWILPRGSWISYKGIRPDVEINLTDEEFKKSMENGTFQAKIDPQMDKAIKYLSKFKNFKEYQKARDKFFKKRVELEKEGQDKEMKELKKKIEEMKK